MPIPGRSPDGSAAHRVGIDLVSVDEVRVAVDLWGRRYLDRVYTPREQAACAGHDGVAPERLAARFAAKEATAKALRVGDAVVPWTTIEIDRRPDGDPVVHLHAQALDLAGRRGVTDLQLSLSHDGGRATAVVLATIDPPGAPR